MTYCRRLLPSRGDAGKRSFLCITLGLVCLLPALGFFISLRMRARGVIQDHVQVGNGLAVYFVSMAEAIQSGRAFAIHKYCTNSQSVSLGRDCPQLIMQLPSFMSSYPEHWSGVRNELKHLPPIYYYGSTASKQWQVFPALYVAMRPVIQELVQKSLVDMGTFGTQQMDANVVIHFRCSDIPFDHTYKFLTYEWYKRALRSLQAQGVPTGQINIIHCSAPTARLLRQTAACAKYAKLLAAVIDSVPGVQKTWVSCGKVDEDFATMARAPALISSISSMSFMAGIASYGNVVVPDVRQTTNHDMQGVSIDNMPCGGVHFSCASTIGMVLNHEDVLDYYDIDSVHNALKTTS